MYSQAGKHYQEIKNQITFSVSRRRFAQAGFDFDKPKEGDLLYFKTTDTLYPVEYELYQEIKRILF